MEIQKLIHEIGINAANKFLSEELFIQVKEYDNFFKYNYNQIFSPKTNKYVMECRALLLGLDGAVIARGYRRFFNYGESLEITGSFKFQGSKILEKADGSMVQVYWNPFDNRWEACTRGTAFAESNQDFYPTFREAIIQDGFGSTEEEFQESMNLYGNKEWTYVFEYISCKNRIVTRYLKPEMVFVVAIDNSTGKEFTL